MTDNSFRSRLRHAWNAFFSRDPTEPWNYGQSTYYRPDMPRFRPVNERTIVTAIYNRIAMDVASIDIVHARLDDEGRYLETIKSDLNNCLTVEANLDQTGRAFIQDVVMSMLDEGCVAIVPVDTTDNPLKTGSYDINTMRTGKIIEWFPEHAKVRVYNEKTGKYEELVLPKRMLAIIENPLFSVINEPNSTMQRLIRKLSLLDYVDEQNSSSKLNMIIQLPYVIKTKSRRIQAENRRKDIEDQLNSSKYGIAYTDGTEKITQLNRPLENNLLAQVEYLTKLLYSQLGMSEEVLNGSADEKVMLNYHNRTIEPIISEIVGNMTRKFLTKTARSQHQAIIFFRNPFKLVTISEIADIGDRFTRNEIMSSNEIRQIIGMKPSNDPAADELRNKNLYSTDSDGDGVPDIPADGSEVSIEGEDQADSDDSEDGLDDILASIQNGNMTEDDAKNAISDIDDLDSQLDELLRMLEEDDELKHYASPYYDPVKAHEYYMKTRELKGRGHSTSGLNDTGKEAAAYVKARLADERKAKLERHKVQTTSTINSLNAYKQKTIAKSNADTKRAVKNLSNSLKSVLNKNSNAMRTRIDSLRNSKNTDLKANKEKTDAAIKSLREQRKSEIDQHRASTQSKIDNLRESLIKMPKADRAAQKDHIRQEIARLREQNKVERDKLSARFNLSTAKLRDSNKKYRDKANEKFKSDTTSERASNKAASNRLRSEQKTKSASYREKHKATSKSARDEYRVKATAARNEHKAYAKKLKNEYDAKYESELNSMKGDSNLQRVYKRKRN